MSRIASQRSVERYPLERSPFAQNPSQRDVAALVRETKENLNTLGLPQYKEQFLVRRTIESKGKKRELVYPDSRLRAVHERLKFQLSKIVQSSYLMSPRRGRSQRDNAQAHLQKDQFLTLDLKQFYPSTTRQMIRNSLIAQFEMQPDVAGLIAHVATADEKACFGSPLTPVLAALVHRPMFDEIADRCARDDLSYTVWVDDLTVSGTAITGEFRVDLRDIVAHSGLKSHKLKTRTGNRPVFITGIGVVGRDLVVPSSTEIRSKELWEALRVAQTFAEFDVCSNRLLSHLGGVRAIVGASSSRGHKLASEMNSIRQKRERARRKHQAQIIAFFAEQNQKSNGIDSEEMPF